MKLTNQTTFITGASDGIGKACAELFATAGSNLVLCARSIDKLEALKEHLTEKHNVKVHVFKLDVRDREKVKEGIKDLPEEFSKIDILINNAGLARGKDKLHEGKIDGWEEMIDTNVKGLLYVTHSIVPGMVRRNSGIVINIGSIAGEAVYPAGNVYCATKFAVRALSDGLRIDTVDTNIKVTNIAPAIVETNFSMVRFDDDKERAERIYKSIDALQPEDIADACLYAATRPAHVQLPNISISPTCQASATVIHRKNDN